jgi:hypothetical protein
MYTEIFVNVDIKGCIPAHVCDVLRYMCADETERTSLGRSVMNGLPSRWHGLFYSGSYHTPDTYCSRFVCDDITGRYSLIGKGDIKNYESEIESFFRWLVPWIYADPGDFIGYIRYEEDVLPTLVLMPDRKAEETKIIDTKVYVQKWYPQ